MTLLGLIWTVFSLGLIDCWASGSDYWSSVPSSTGPGVARLWGPQGTDCLWPETKSVPSSISVSEVLREFENWTDSTIRHPSLWYERWQELHTPVVMLRPSRLIKPFLLVQILWNTSCGLSRVYSSVIFDTSDLWRPKWHLYISIVQQARVWHLSIFGLEDVYIFWRSAKKLYLPRLQSSSWPPFPQHPENPEMVEKSLPKWN